MSVEALGRDLLGEVRTERLNELLHSFQEVDSNSASPLGFPALDQLLDVFQHPPQSRQQRQYQSQWSPQQEGTAPLQREKPPRVIEITNAAASSGKTQLLYHIVAVSLLPENHKDVPITGKGNAVVLFDLSGKFSVLRLQRVMQGHISSKCSSAMPEQEISSLVSDSFTHLHIFRPQSSSSLLATLTSLKSFLLTLPSTHFSANRPLGLLAINDLSAFLWQDRLDADEGMNLPTSINAEKANNVLFLERHRNFVSSLRQIQRLFSCTIVATNWGMAPVASVAGHAALRPHLPSSWNNFCTVKVVLERDRVSKFGPGFSAEEAKKEGVQRWQAVERSGFSGWVNWWGNEGWREEVKEGIKGLKNRGRFWFRFNGNGVLMP